MNSQILSGAAFVLTGGIAQGLFAVPMKFARRWNWENIWFTFAFSGLVFFPWLLTWLTVPHVAEIYRLTPARSMMAIVGFGLCWGIGATLTGLGLSILGIGLGLAIILGLSASIGSLVPLLILDPEKMATPQGRSYLIGTAVMLIGIGFAARAGALRDANHVIPEAVHKGSFLKGLFICVGSGLLSSALNFSYSFGADAAVQARNLGVSPLWTANVVTAPAITGGFVANLIYCVHLMRKNSSFSRFYDRGIGINWIYGASMGALWFGGQALYGVGVYRMGELGTVIGWPVLMGMIVITSNVAGLATDEWKGSSARSRAYLLAGMLIILVALAILSLGQKS
jgi:L-rhamnose-H+ transport protein